MIAIQDTGNYRSRAGLRRIHVTDPSRVLGGRRLLQSQLTAFALADAVALLTLRDGRVSHRPEFGTRVRSAAVRA